MLAWQLNGTVALNVRAQVEEVLKNSIVAVNCGEVAANATLGIQYGNETLNDGSTVRQKDAPQDLDLVSWPPSKNWVKKMPGYDYEVAAGFDTYVYIIDLGINMLSTVSDQWPSVQDWGFVLLSDIKDFTKMPFQPIEWHFAPSVSKLTGDESAGGHGSCTASKATVSVKFSLCGIVYRFVLWFQSSGSSINPLRSHFKGAKFNLPRVGPLASPKTPTSSS